MSITIINGALTSITGSMITESLEELYYAYHIERAVTDLLAGVSIEDVQSNPCGIFSHYVLRNALRETIQKNLIAVYEARQACMYGEGVKPS